MQARTNQGGVLFLTSIVMIKHDEGMRDIGYFLLNNGKLELVGFPEITETTKVRVTEVEDNVVAIYLADEGEELKDGEYITFSEKAKSSKCVIDYLVEHNAIGHLFVKLFNCYFLCKTIEIGTTSGKI